MAVRRHSAISRIGEVKKTKWKVNSAGAEGDAMAPERMQEERRKETCVLNSDEDRARLL